jgi:two-component system, sensor histidine kinase and response regulator
MNDQRPRVLLVDDVEANLIALDAQLARLDCELVRASSGNEALRLLLKQEFAVIVLDVQMPEMDGFEVARLARLEASSRTVPIIFVTAMHETEEAVLRGYETGAVDLLFKPVNPYILRSKVQVFLELYRNRRQLAREIEAHEQTLADLRAFNDSVAHDLRAPLRALDGFSRILLEDHAAKLDDEAKQHLLTISAAARRMGQLIDDLFRLSQVGRAAARPEPIDLTSLVESIIAEIREGDPRREVTLVAPAGIVGRGDARLVGIMLQNLLRNAWKFTSKNPRATIELGVRVENGETIYFVRDDGAGFDSTYADRLFQPFQRLHSALEFEGTGIGLAIVRRIIDHHGGRVWAESSLGFGATLFFTLASRTPSS